MTAQPSDQHVACATLTYLAQPADPLLGSLLRLHDPADLLARIRSGTLPTAAAATLDAAQETRIRPALTRWQTGSRASPPMPVWPGMPRTASTWCALAIQDGHLSSTTSDLPPLRVVGTRQHQPAVHMHAVRGHSRGKAATHSSLREPGQQRVAIVFALNSLRTSWQAGPPAAARSP